MIANSHMDEIRSQAESTLEPEDQVDGYVYLYQAEGRVGAVKGTDKTA
jgi:hypothetical protein